MEIKVNSYRKQSTLISSIVFFIIGGILFTNPDIFITTISKIFGVILLILGLFFLSSVFINKDNEDYNLLTRLISAIFFIGLAVVFFFFSETIEKAIRVVVGFWILFCGINRLINALKITNRNKKFFSLVIISLLLIVVGIYTIVVGDVLLSTIGIILMIYSAIDIIGYIFYAKETDEVHEINEDTILITSEEEPVEVEKETKKKKKRRKTKSIKDAKTTEK